MSGSESLVLFVSTSFVMFGLGYLIGRAKKEGLRFSDIKKDGIVYLALGFLMVIIMLCIITGLVIQE